MNEKQPLPNLMEEYPLLVYPSLAEFMGVNRAIVFQQLHFLLNAQRTSKNEYVFVDGRWWVYNSYAEWKETYFSWLSTSALKGIFLSLEKDLIVITKRLARNKSDRRKWYTIDYTAWDRFKLGIGQKMSHQPSDKIYPINGLKVADGYSDTSSETSDRKSADAQLPTIKFPKSVKSYTTEHIQAYQALHLQDMTMLVKAWAGDMYSTITEFTNKVGRQYIETHMEFMRLNTPNSEYTAIAVHTKKCDAWKTSPAVTDMLLHLTDYKPAPKPVQNGKPMTETEYDLLLIKERQEKEAMQYGWS